MAFVLNDYACRRLFEEFIADTNDGFIVVDPNGIVLEINQNYCDFLGKTRPVLFYTNSFDTEKYL